tara:strand:+ start:2327 stop:3571 length:1245 start_codon:yes stop_codon:yes gene_type:complete
MSAAATQQKMVPELRFPGFLEPWEVKYLKDVATFRRGSFPQPYGLKKWYDPKNGLPFVQVFDVDDNFSLKKETKSRISKLAQPMSVFVPKGSVVITIQGSIGRIAITQYDAYVDRTLLIFKEMKQSFAKLFFVYSVYLCFEEEKRKAPGGTIKTITKEVLSSFTIPVPDVAEQQKIADFLGSVDAWLDNLRQQKTALETYKKGMMQKLFTQQVRFKDDEGNNFLEWDGGSLGDIATSVKGRGLSKEDIEEDGKNVCIRYAELYTTYDEVILSIASKTNHGIDGMVLSKEGDLLFPSSGETALDIATFSCLMEEGVIMSGDLNAIRFNKEVHTPFFAYYLTNHLNREIAKYAQGNSVVHLYWSHFKRVDIKMPSLGEQKKIADFLFTLDQSISDKAAEIEKVEQWRKGLMQKMFV